MATTTPRKKTTKKEAPPIAPFKMKKNDTKGKKLEAVEAPDDLTALVDEFKENAELSKKYEGKKKALAAQIKPFAMQKAAERRLAGNPDNFNILGDEKMCQFQMTERISGGTDEAVAAFAATYGEQAAEELYQKDYSSLKINGDYLKAHWNELIPKLTKALGDHFEPLFTEMAYKLADNGLEKAKDFVETPEELVALYEKMKVTSFIK